MAHEQDMAMILDVAVRTIESRRSRAMIKLQARSLSELVRNWIRVRQIEARMRVSGMCNAAYVPDARKAYEDGVDRTTAPIRITAGRGSLFPMRAATIVGWSSNATSEMF